MSEQSPKHLIQVDGNTSTACAYCRYYVDSQKFPDGANHYLQAHGMRVIAAGHQTSRDLEGHPYSYPFVLLGGDEIPPPVRPVTVEIVGVPPKAS